MIRIMNWIKFEEKQPNESGKYFTFDADCNYYAVLPYSKKHNAFNAGDSEYKPAYPLHVTHWCELESPID